MTTPRFALTLILPIAALVSLDAWSPASPERARPAPPQAASAAGAVEVGWCVSLDRIAEAKAAGFQYVEMNTTQLTTMTDAEFDAAAERIKANGLAVPVTNSFLPATIRLTGPDIKPEEQMTYVIRAFTRLQRLGTRIVVFGSGGARRFPEGFSKEEAFAQLVDFGKRIAVEARTRGITVAVEPLGRQESNIINSAREGLALVKAINDPNFQLMIDFYHLASEKEDPQIVIDGKDYLRHLHMANPTGRVFPLKWEEFDYAPFFANLRKIGYKGRISVEASSKDVPAEGPVAIALLKKAFVN